MKILKILKFLVFTFVECCFFAFNSINYRRVKKKKQKTLVILRPDAIGDYLLFRNFLEVLRKSSTYQDYHIIYCGNKIVQDLAEWLDHEWVDEFIWFDRHSLLKKLPYRLKFLKTLWSLEIEEILYAAHSREYYIDLLVFLSGSKVKVAPQGDLGNCEKWQKILSDHFYTRLMKTSSALNFEFIRNKEMIEGLLQNSASSLNEIPFLPFLPFIDKTKLPPFHSPAIQSPYLVLFPGAGHPSRQWDPLHWAQVLAALALESSSLFQGQIVLCGSPQEKEIGEVIEKFLEEKNLTITVTVQKKIINLIGQLSLGKVVSLMSNASLVLANESMAPHLAQALKVPFVCLSNGNHYLRFHPYPTYSDSAYSDPTYSNSVYLYPEEMKNLGETEEERAKKLASGSPLPLDHIEEQKVIQTIAAVLEKSQKSQRISKD